MDRTKCEKEKAYYRIKEGIHHTYICLKDLYLGYVKKFNNSIIRQYNKNMDMYCMEH